jgi:hypothetical protein
MLKDFDKWNKIKKETDNKNVILDFHEREVWWCSLRLLRKMGMVDEDEFLTLKYKFNNLYL